MCLGIVLFACVALGISKSVATSCRNIQIAFGIWLIIMFINAILFKGVVNKYASHVDLKVKFDFFIGIIKRVIKGRL